MPEELLFATRFVPVRPASGSPIRTHRLATGLARRFDVTLVALDRDPTSQGPPPAAAELARELPDVEVIAVRAPRARKRLHQLASLPGRRSWLWGQYATPALRQAIHRVARDRGAAIVHLDDPGVALAGPVAGAVNAFAPHNVEHEILRSSARSSAGLRRAFAELEAAKVRREEAGQWRWADLCVAVSELDADTMRRGGARRVVVAPNGTDPVARRPPPARGRGEPLRLLFVGANYLPNRLGLEWLLEEVLPAVRSRIPVALDVVGLAIAAQRDGDVRVHGHVPSVAPFYARAHAAVVPIFIGSGTRLKVLEAMAHGVPVVSTSLGAAGLGLRTGEHYLGADDAHAFAEAIVAVARRLEPGGDPLEPMLAAARATAEAFFWPRIADALAAAYDAALGEARHPAPARRGRPA